MSETKTTTIELPKRKTVDDVLKEGFTDIYITEDAKVYTYEAGNAPKGTYRRDVFKRYPVGKRERTEELDIIEGYLNGLSVLRRSLSDEEKSQAKRCFALVLKSKFLGMENEMGPAEPKYWGITGSDKALRGFPAARRYRQEFGGLNKRGFNMLARVVPLLGNEETNRFIQEEILSHIAGPNTYGLEYRISQVVKIFSAKGAKLDEANAELFKQALDKYHETDSLGDNAEKKWRKETIRQAKKILT